MDMVLRKQNSFHIVPFLSFNIQRHFDIPLPPQLKHFLSPLECILTPYAALQLALLIVLFPSSLKCQFYILGRCSTYNAGCSQCNPTGATMVIFDDLMETGVAIVTSR